MITRATVVAAALLTIATRAPAQAADMNVQSAASPATNSANGAAFKQHPGMLLKHFDASPAAPEARALAAPAATTAPRLKYYGGPVLDQVNVVAVFWGSRVAASTQNGIGAFLSALTSSSFFDWLSEYDTTVAGGTGQSIGHGTFGESVLITPKNRATNLQDADVQTEIEEQIVTGVLPPPSSNTLYVSYFPPGTAITMQNARSCVDFCGYHSTYVGGHGTTFYAVIPDLTSGGCASGCGREATPFDNLTSVTSHEVIEAVTDPAIGLLSGNAPKKPLGWYDAKNGEIGDICVAQTGAITAAGGATYRVQTEFSDKKRACIVQ